MRTWQIKHIRKARARRQKANDESLKAKRRAAAYDVVYLSVCGVCEVVPEHNRVEKMDLKLVHQLSKSLAVEALTYSALKTAYDSTLPDIPLLKTWENEKDFVIYKNICFEEEWSHLVGFMEKSKIWYMPLKGMVIKDLYPKMEMRQMCDIDVLYDQAYQERIKNWFLKRGYTTKIYNIGNVDSYLKKPFYNFEMHRALIDPSNNKVWADYYENVKDRLLQGPKLYEFHFSDADFYVYLIVHMYKHHSRGGTGIRSILDLYFYLKEKGKDLPWEYIHQELEKLGVIEFEEQVIELCKKIFSDPVGFQITLLTKDEQYFLDSFLSYGAYGTIMNSTRHNMMRMAPEEDTPSIGTKLHYLWWRIFPDKEVFKEYYPFFYQHKWLMPVGYIYRLVYKGITQYKKALAELKAIQKG